LRPLPEALAGPVGAALHQLLEQLRQQVGETEIDLLWIFAPDPGKPAPGGVLVASAYEPAAPDRRRVFTSHFVRRTETGSPSRISVAVAEHGTAPLERLERVIAGVLRRVEDGPAATPPHLVRLEGNAERWATLAAALQGGTGAGVVGG
jgi:hypothetical protein